MPSFLEYTFFCVVLFFKYIFDEKFVCFNGGTHLKVKACLGMQCFIGQLVWCKDFENRPRNEEVSCMHVFVYSK